MRRGFMLFLFLFLCRAGLLAQDYRDSLHVVTKAGYLKQVKLRPDKKLGEIIKYIPGIKLDIRYATLNNFMHRCMYSQPRAFARLPVIDALKGVETDLAAKGLGLKIYDAYRPYTVTVSFYQQASDKNFVADPKKGSKHNRGCAIDLSLIDLKTGNELDMPTPFDSFSPKAAANYQNLPPRVTGNRQVLIDVMQRHGFKVLENEWWHFDFTGWEKYELLDIPFEQL